jgi:large subunit ribosomal protein L6
MSKIGKQPIKIPEGVSLVIDGNTIKVKGPLGENSLPILHGLKPIFENGELRFETLNTSGQTRSNWGTMRSLAANAVKGVQEGFSKTLILEGIGFKIAKEGNNLTLNLGFSHPVKFDAPAGITFEVEKNTVLKIKGIDKFLVGQVAAEIRALKKPEPYKGTGFRYSDEVIRRKAGKKAVATSGAGA